VLETVKLGGEIGFCVIPEKSCLIPSQEIVFLGMSNIKLTEEKNSQKIVKACKALQIQPNYTIREVGHHSIDN
jgi:hypothetical protein